MHDVTGLIQPSSPPPVLPHSSYGPPPISVTIAVTLFLFLLVGFCSLFFSRCFMQNSLRVWRLQHGAAAAAGTGGDVAPAAPGLDPSTILSFPSFSYSTVKGYRREKYGLECAICLIEFQDSDVLRLMTSCCHVFHQECIDLWLESHKTCPVCRRKLDSPIHSPPNIAGLESVTEDQDCHVSIIININEDVENRVCENDAAGCSNSVVQDGNRLSKSHSTGHSSVNRNEEEEDKRKEDRFTLRLPENVKSNIIKGHHSSSKSWTTFGDHQLAAKSHVRNNGLPRT